MDKKVNNTQVQETVVDVYQPTCDTRSLYLYRGQMFDKLGKDCKWRKLRLHVPDECKSSLESIWGMRVYQCKSVNDDGHWDYSDLYFTSEEASQHARFNRGVYAVMCYLCTTKPVVPSEFIVVLKRDEKGKLFTMINNHPELWGSEASGKIFFPDRLWRDVNEGMAKVKIVYEKPMYGFISGAMLPDATQSEVLDYLWKYNDFEGEVVKLEHIETGKCLFFVSSYSGSFRRAFMHKDGLGLEGHLTTEDIALTYPQYRCTTFPVVTLMLMDRYGMSKADVEQLADFKESDFYSTYIHSPYRGNRFDMRWESERAYRMPDGILGRAVRSGYVQTAALSSHTDVQVYTISVSGIASATELSLEEFRQLVSEFNQANQNADEAIRLKIKKGKIRMVGA